MATLHKLSGSSYQCLRAGRRSVRKKLHPDEETWLLVVLKVLRVETLHACDDEEIGEHLVHSRRFARVREKHFRSRLSKTFDNYGRRCREYQRRKTPSTRLAGLFQPIESPTKRFQQIRMDLLGLFPLSSTGNRRIFTATDNLARYAEPKPLPHGTATEVATFFPERILLCHGAAEVAVADSGITSASCCKK